MEVGKRDGHPERSRQAKVGKRDGRRKRSRRAKPGQLLLWKPRGGKRRGAGRKPKGRRAGSPHRARAELDARHPVHVTLRAIPAVGSLRRYHAEIITSPTQARHTLSYVLGNWRKHGEDRRLPMSEWKVDWFSSAAMFPDWAEYQEDEYALWQGPETYEPLVVHRPRSWLLREGWKKVGTISTREVPSARR